MKNVIKEFSWVLLGVLLGLVVSYRFTKQVLSGDTILDINVHDTYFIIDAFEGVLLSVFFFVFLVYIFRSFKLQFKSIVTLLVLIFSGIGLIFIFNGILSMIGILQSLHPEMFFSAGKGWTMYPPLSSPEVDPNPAWPILYYFIEFLQIVVILILIYSAYRTGRKRC